MRYWRTFSRTSGSSIAARFSRGESSTCACSGPPTYSTNLPNSSLNAVRTSSSSSTDSAQCVSVYAYNESSNTDIPSRKGISSSRVRSAPSARAMVLRRWIALSRRITSSCFSSSMRTAIGYSSSFCASMMGCEGWAAEERVRG